MGNCAVIPPTPTSLLCILKPTWHKMAVINDRHLQEREQYTAIYSLSVL